MADRIEINRSGIISDQDKSVILLPAGSVTRQTQDGTHVALIGDPLCDGLTETILVRDEDLQGRR